MRKNIAFTLLFLILGIAGILYWSISPESQKQKEALGEKTRDEGTKEKEGAAMPRLVSQEIALPDGTKIELQIAEGLGIAIAADGLGKARFMAKSPDGRLFVPDMKNASDNAEGKIYVFDGFDERTKRFQEKTVYLSKRSREKHGQ